MNENRIRIAQIDFLHHHVKTMLLGVSMTSLVVTAIFYNTTDNFVLFSWLGAVSSLTFIRYLSVRKYHSRKQSNKETLYWGRLFIFFMFLSGCTWGAASLLFFNPDNPTEVLILTMVQTGVLVASLATMSAVLAAYYSFALATGLPLIYVFITAGTEEFFLFGILAAIFLLVQLGLSKVTNRTLNESVSLRFENLDLIKQLKKEKSISVSAQKQAESANFAKTKFLAAASHDLRQPLHAQNLFLGVLEGKLEKIDHKDIVVKIQKSNQVLSDLLEDLLDISKLDANIIEVRPESIFLHDLLTGIKSEFNELAIEKGLSLHISCNHYRTKTDRHILQRILRNLISNAIRYTSSGGIVVGIRNRGNKIAICVYDTGLGIPPNKQDEIFNEFYQLHNPERDRTKGFGLGLSIVRRLSSLLDAELEIKSKPGKGSMFALVLGKENDQDLYSDITLPTLDIIDFTKRTILIVDDEIDILNSMSVLLESWNYQVIAASSGKIAINKLQNLNNMPNLILTDYRLKNNETGIDVISAIHSQYGANIPAAIITGDTDPKRIKEANSSGYSLLHKPISAEKLAVLIPQLISNHVIE